MPEPTNLEASSEPRPDRAMGPGAVPPPVPAKPDIDALHRDIALANAYRLEGIKTSITVAGALVAFTVSFRPTLQVVSSPWMMLLSWLTLGASIFGGLVNMHGWTRFYVSYRDYDWKLRDSKVRADANEGRDARRSITRWRSFGAACQWVGLAIGVVFLAIFSWQNLPNIVPKAP